LRVPHFSGALRVAHFSGAFWRRPQGEAGSRRGRRGARARACRPMSEMEAMSAAIFSSLLARTRASGRRMAATGSVRTPSPSAAGAAAAPS